MLEYARNGVNALYLDPKQEGWRRQPGVPAVDPCGGRCDIGPECVITPHPDLWLGDWKGEITGKDQIRLTSKRDGATGIRLVREFTLAVDSSRLVCEQRIINESDNAVTCCHWSRTLAVGGDDELVDPAGLVVIPDVSGQLGDVLRVHQLGEPTGVVGVVAAGDKLGARQIGIAGDRIEAIVFLVSEFDPFRGHGVSTRHARLRDPLGRRLIFWTGERSAVGNSVRKPRQPRRKRAFCAAACAPRRVFFGRMLHCVNNSPSPSRAAAISWLDWRQIGPNATHVIPKRAANFKRRCRWQLLTLDENETSSLKS